MTTEEIARLIESLGQTDPSQRRRAGIVRRAPDPGLRSGGVARISLDDIDWRAGTITLRHTKGRREDVRPLPKQRTLDLRHRYATFLVTGGRTFYEVQQTLAHSDPSVALRY